MSVIYINSYQFAAPVSYDPDAAAYIARVEGASGDNAALETAVKDAINTFVVGCKADGTWNAIKASCILAGARTLAGALQPLAGTAPTNNGFIGIGTDYNRKTGLLGNGTSKYLDSGRGNTTDPQDSKHLAVYATTAGTRDATRAVIGVGVTAAGDSHLVATASLRIPRINYGSAPLISDNTAIAGLEGGSRPDSTQIIYHYNSLSTSYSSSSTNPSSGNILVFARGGTPAQSFSNARLAFYSIGEHLDLGLLDARVTTLINAFAAAIP